MTPRFRTVVVLVWVLAAAVIVATGSLRRGATESEAPLEAIPPLAPGQGVPASFETEDTLPSALKGVTVEPVQGRTGPGGETFYLAVRSREGADHLSRQIGQRTFRLALRVSSPDLTQYPCTSCHEGQNITRRETERDDEGVHHNIQPVHPAETGAQCLTCHAADDVGTLRLENGGTVSIDHAYRLCAQCHFSQVEWWANGAHGKRLGGWRGRRVVTGCADCHNPHRPATEPRIPLGGVQLPGELGGEAHD